MESVLSLVVDALPGLVWTAFPDGQVDFLNRRWCEYTGLSADENRGGGWYAAIHPEDLSKTIQRWQSIVTSDAPNEFETRLRRFDGEYRRFLVRACPLADATGQIIKWCGINIDIEERGRAEETEHSRWWLWPPGREEHFRSIIDDLPAHAVHLRPNGDIEHVNRQVRDYFGASLEEMKSWEIDDVVHPNDLPGVAAAWKAAVESGRFYDVESRLRRADGVYRWFHTRGFPLRDAQERIVLWYLLQNDIDDRKRAEALLAGEARLLELVAANHSMTDILKALCHFVESTTSGCYCSVVLIDPSGTRLEHGAAPSLPDSFITGIIGRPVNADSGPCAMAAYLNEQVIASDLSSETRWSADAWPSMALAHGLRSCWSTPISSRAGKVLGAFAIYHSEPRAPTPQHENLIDQFTHIASIAIERTQSDAALKRSEAFLSQAQHLSSTCSFFWRVETEEITWSEEAYNIFDLDRTMPVTNELIYSRIHPEDMPFLVEMMDRARDGSGTDFEYEHRLLMPDRSIKYVRMVCQGTRDWDGRLEYIAAVQDVTHRRLSEQALGKARSELARVARITSLGALTASIAHEVNQPLSGIITNASTCLRMLAADPPNVDGARETARRTIRDGNRASDVITRLRALFTKKDATTEMVDLNETTREVIALSLSELQRSQVVLRREFADDLPPVTGDRVQLQQVILNLLLNASDAMSGVDDRPRELVVRTERDEGDHVRLIVQDAGVGFDPQSAERLFDAFYTTKSSGMGIGLSVSRSIIESHHGRLWAAPNNGPGATFSFSIPRQPKDGRNFGGMWTPTAPAAPHVMRNS